jgi:hypothetical protein
MCFDPSVPFAFLRPRAASAAPSLLTAQLTVPEAEQAAEPLPDLADGAASAAADTDTTEAG